MPFPLETAPCDLATLKYEQSGESLEGPIESRVRNDARDEFGVGSKELACGSQAFIATLLFDP